jgi:hypothetical protein
MMRTGIAGLDHKIILAGAPDQQHHPNEYDQELFHWFLVDT